MKYQSFTERELVVMRKYHLSFSVNTGRSYHYDTYAPIEIACILAAVFGSVSNVSISPVPWLG